MHPDFPAQEPPPAGRRPRTGFRGGFTLIELLTVITIISILLVASIPMFSDPTNSARQASRELVRGHLQQARAHAIATGSPTAVIFADYGADSVNGGRLIGIAEVEPQTAATPPASNAPYKVTRVIQRWQSLPGSIFFLNRNTAGASQDTVMDQGTKIDAPYSKRTISGSFIIFAPSGQITYPAASPTGSKISIAFGPALLQGGGVKSTQRSDAGPVFDFLQVNRLNGRARLAHNP